MTFREVQIGQRFILETDVAGGHGPFRKLSATKLVGCWDAVQFKMKDLDAPVAECCYCNAPLLADGRLDYYQVGPSFAHRECISVSNFKGAQQ